MKRRLSIALGTVVALLCVGAIAYDRASRGWDDELARARASLETAPETSSGRDGSMALEAALSRLEQLPDDQGNAVFLEVHRLFAPAEWDRALEKIPAAEREKAVTEHEQRLDQALRSLDRVFPLADQALVGYDVWRFGPPPDSTRGYPHWDRLQALFDLLSARAARSVRLHREGEAWDDVERLARLGATIQDPYLIALLFRIQLLDLATMRIETLHARVRLEPARRARLLALLEKIEPAGAAPLALATEARVELDAYGPSDAGLDRLAKRIDSVETRIALGAEHDGLKKFLGFPRALQRAIVTRDRARYLALLAEVVAAARLPWPDAAPSLREIEKRFHDHAPAWAPLTRSGALPFVNVVLREREAIARLRLARIALAATEGGEVPATPLALDDPFFPGRPMGWRAHEGRRRAVATSVGPDGAMIAFDVVIPPGQ